MAGEIEALVHAEAQRRISAVVMLSQVVAAEMQVAMQQLAPWTDRTANARNGLTAVPFIRPGRAGGQVIGIDAGHGVEYGVYLEKKNAGRFAIVDPMVDTYGPRYIALAKAILEGGS